MLSRIAVPTMIKCFMVAVYDFLRAPYAKFPCCVPFGARRLSAVGVVRVSLDLLLCCREICDMDDKIVAQFDEGKLCIRHTRPAGIGSGWSSIPIDKSLRQ